MKKFWEFWDKLLRRSRPAGSAEESDIESPAQVPPYGWAITTDVFQPGDGTDSFVAYGSMQELPPPVSPPTLPSEPDDSASHESSELSKALIAAMNSGEDQDILLMQGNYSVKTKEEARLICDLLRQIPVLEALSRLSLTALFDRVETTEAFEELQSNGIPELCKIVDANLDDEDDCTSDDASSALATNDLFALSELKKGGLLVALRILAMYRTEEGTRQVVKAARKPFRPDSSLWSTVLKQFDKDHPHTVSVMTEMSNPLPVDFIAIALLEQANTNAIEGMQVTHPFDSAAGLESLRKWLGSSNTEEFSYAVSATVSLPFISQPGRNDLLALAMDHPSVDVKLEAAWASAKLGNQIGIDLLSESCLDPNQSRKAKGYLAEVDRSDAIPDEAYDADFIALAEMSEWLAHPQEFGRAPDSLELFDKRTLYWPPTDDWRPLWLFKYCYKDEDEEDDVGIGMVGAVTFALFGESTADKSPIDVYALHCCWELKRNGDDRSPEERTVKAGREILAKYNPDLVS